MNSILTPSDPDSPCPSPAELLANPAVSYWLKDSLAKALGRDPVDAANDAELLARVLHENAMATLAAAD